MFVLMSYAFNPYNLCISVEASYGEPVGINCSLAEEHNATPKKRENYISYWSCLVSATDYILGLSLVSARDISKTSLDRLLSITC